MALSKLEIKIGQIEFSGEGEEEWLSEQLDKIIEKVPDLLKIKTSAPTKQVEAKTISPSTTKENLTGTLASFLKEKNATSNQAKKFLATAVYLQKTGKARLVTRDVIKALKDARHTKLTNPSDCLNQQVKKGFCEKDGNQFYVTPEGENSI